MSNKHPSFKYSPKPTKVPSTTKEIDNLESKKFRWRISSQYIDLDHNEWGWATRSNIDCFFNILEKHLHRFEDTEWVQLKNQRSCHPLPVERIVEKAQKRLCDKCPDIDSLFQVKVGGKARVWGVRKEDILYLIWYDPDHTVYPVDF